MISSNAGGFLILFVSFLLGYLQYLDQTVSENNTWIMKVGIDLADNIEKFTAMNQSAFILGGTGEVGKELVKLLVEKNIFQQIVLIGRRKIEFDNEAYKNVEQKVVDFDHLDDYADAFKDLDVGFCCLGTTKGKAGAAGFVKVDHDYALNAAKLAKEGGCKHFSLVSAQSANKNSFFLYPKTKGLLEEHISQLQFTRFSIYRPGILLCDRQERRSMEIVAGFLLKPIYYFYPTLLSVPTLSVAKAMVNNAITPSNQAIEVFENKDIHLLSKN